MQKQNGSVLLISLMILIVLTLMAFSLSNSIVLQQQMTSANRDDAIAFQVAEFALRDGEKQAQQFAIDGAYTIGGNQGLYDGRNCPTDSTSPDYNNCALKVFSDIDLFNVEDSWKNTNSRAAETEITCTYGDDCPETITPGRYKIVLLGQADCLDAFGSGKISVITSANQTADEIGSSICWRYQVIAIGQGLNPENKRVLTSYLITPAP